MTLFSKHYLPLTIVLCFNLFTLFIFFTAPIEWKTNNLYLFTLFVLFCQASIAVGYYLGYRIGLSKSKNPLRKKNIFYDISQKSLIFIFIFYSLTFLIRYAYLLRFNALDIRGMFQFLLLGVVDPHLGYSLTVDPTRSPTIPWTIYFLISVINQVFFIIGFVCWKRYNIWQKFLFIFFLLIEIFFWFGRATNMGIISLITTFIFAQILTFYVDPLKSVKPVKPILIVLISLIISISVFSFTLNTRKGSSALDYQEFNLGYSKVNENSKVFSVVPKPLVDTYMYVTSYFSQGYYHTCLALDLGFRPTYFLGNNPAIISLAELMGINVWKDTYIYRLNVKGVDPLVSWHSP